MALTKAQLLSLVAANLPDNITQQITPSLHRQVLNEAIDAMYPVPVQPVETIPAYNPLTTYEPGPDQYVIFNDLIWKFISATSQKGVEPGTNAAVWQEIIFNELAHIQNTDLRMGDYLALVEEDGPTIDMCDGAFSDSIYLVNNIFVFWPATNGAERPYSLKTVGTRRLTHTFIVMVHPSYLGSLKFESDANQVIGDEALILEPGEFAVFKGALGGPAIAAPKTQLLYKGGTMGPGDKHFVYEITNQVYVGIQHELAKKPSVTILDTQGKQVFANIEYPDQNTVIIRFSEHFTGQAILN